MSKIEENKKTYELPSMIFTVREVSDVIRMSGNVLEEDYYEGNK